MQRIHNVVMCPCSKGYAGQQLIAGRSIKASYAWLDREQEQYGTHKERRIVRAGADVRGPYAEVNMEHLTSNSERK